jgi:hypothetical protein
MKSIRNWKDLEQYGIFPLTGEACAISARLLCDLNKNGEKLIKEFLGIPQNATLADNWNSIGISSIFLPYGILQDLAAFLLLSTGYTIAYAIKDGEIIGINQHDDGDCTDEHYTIDEHTVITGAQAWICKHYGSQITRTYTTSNHPRRGLSCTHQMTNRSM